MKIIPKMASGGNVGNFFMVYDPLVSPLQTLSSGDSRATQAAKAKAAAVADDDKGKLTLKDLFNMLNGLDGLPNEMAGLVSELLTMFTLDSLTGSTSSNLASRILQTKMQLQILKQNSQKFDEAVKTAKENGALGEIAIDEEGKVFVQNADGSPARVEAGYYLAHRDKLKPLTNSKLATLRSHERSLINNLEYFDVLNNAIGFEGFLKLLKLGLTNLGSSQTLLSGTYAKAGDIYAGLQAIGKLSKEQILSLGSSLDGLYRYDYLDKSSLELVLALRNYLLSVLPKKALTYAQVKTGIQDPVKAATALIDNYLLSTTSPETAMKVSYQNSFEKLQGSGSGSGDGGSGSGIEKVKDTVSSRWLRGAGNKSYFRFNSGTATTFTAEATSADLVNADGKPLGANATLQDATKGLFGPVLDLKNASIAGDRINSAVANQIVLRDGKISRVDFPLDPTKDFPAPLTDPAVIKRREAAHKQLKLAGINRDDKNSVAANYAKVSEIYKKNELPNEFNSDGTLSAQWGMFAVMDAAFDKRALGENAVPSLLEKIRPGAAWNSIADVIEKNSGQSESSGYIFGLGADTLYNGTLWIPVDNDQIKALTSADMTVNQTTEAIALQQAASTGIKQGPRENY